MLSEDILRQYHMVVSPCASSTAEVPRLQTRHAGELAAAHSFQLSISTQLPADISPTRLKEFQQQHKMNAKQQSGFQHISSFREKEITSPFSGMERNILTVKTHTDGVCSNRESTCPRCISALSEE